MGFLKILELLLTLMPTVLNVVKAVEVAVPQAGAGAQKLKTVLAVVEAAALAAPPVMTDAKGMQTAVKAGDLPALSSGLAHLIGSVVRLFNATGAFQKSGFVQGVTAAQAGNVSNTP